MARKDPFVKRMENAASWLPPSAWYGRKVFLAPLAHEMNIPMEEFERTVIRLHQAGIVELSRADMVQAMEPRMVRASEVHPPGMRDVTYHFWNATGGSKPMTLNPRNRPFLDGPRGTERELTRLRRDQDIVARQLRLAHDPEKVALLQDRERNLQWRVDELVFGGEQVPNGARGFGTGGDCTGYVFYRIQSSKEHPESLLNPERPDGWTTSEETLDTQPHGISCVSDLADMRGYMDTYNLYPQPGDRVLRLYGYPSQEEDADQYAQRAIVTGWEDIGDAKKFAALTKELGYSDLKHMQRRGEMEELLEQIRDAEQVPNHSAVHYVWLIDYRGVPLETEGPYGPMSLARAEAFARIGAKEGDHDRVVSIGDQVMSDGFEIVRRYRRGTGERTQ